MNQAARRVLLSTLFVLIVLPHAERAAVLEQSLSRSVAVEGAYILADAAERFAVKYGFYPSNVASMDHYFPGGRQLRNGATGIDSEPVDGAAFSPGEIGYAPINQGGLDVGYTITVFGRDATVGPGGDGLILQVISAPGYPSPAPE